MPVAIKSSYVSICFTKPGRSLFILLYFKIFKKNYCTDVLYKNPNKFQEPSDNMYDFSQGMPAIASSSNSDVQFLRVSLV